MLHELMILSFVVRTTLMIDFDVSVTLVGDLTICARLKRKQKAVKARPSGPFPRMSQFRSPSNTTVKFPPPKMEILHHQYKDQFKQQQAQVLVKRL